MPERIATVSFLGGAAVVLLSGVAAFVGAGLSRTQPVAGPASERSPDTVALEAIERRLAYIEKRLDLVEQKAGTALDLARNAEEERLRSGHAGATSPGSPSTSSEPTKPASDAGVRPGPEGGLTDGDQMDRLREIAHSNQKGAVVYQMSLFTDATREGTENRRAQAMADTQTMMNVLALKGDEVEEKVRTVLLDHWERGAREIGPIVHDGIEKADVGTVRERLRGLYAETDRGMRPLLDEETWKRYEAATGGMRKVQDAILDEMEKERLRIK